MARRDDNLAHLPDDAEADNAARCIDLHLSKRKKPRGVTIERARRGAPEDDERPSALEQLTQTRRAAETAWRLMGDDLDPPAEPRDPAPSKPSWGAWDDGLPPAPERAADLSRQIRDAATEQRQLVVEARHGHRWAVHLCTELENADAAVALVHELQVSGEADEVCMTLETVQGGGRTQRLEMLRAAGSTRSGAITASRPEPAAEESRDADVPAPPAPPQPAARAEPRTEQSARAADVTDDILANWLDKVDGRRHRPSVLDDDEDDEDARDVVAKFNAGIARKAIKQALLVALAAAIILGGLLAVLHGAWAPSGFSAQAFPQTGVLSPN